jgi:hypothetical protein
MSILNRLTKLEKDNPNKPPCFCGKTLLDLWYGTPGADVLTFCARCKGKYDFWAKLAKDAATSENLTNIGTEKYNDSN